MEETKKILQQRERLWAFVLAAIGILWSMVGIYLPNVKWWGDLSLRGWWYMVGWGVIVVLGAIYVLIVELGERPGVSERSN